MSVNLEPGGPTERSGDGKDVERRVMCSTVESKAEKIVREYRQKIRNCDILLSSAGVRLSNARRGNDLEEYENIAKHMAVVYAQQQAYIQTIADFDSLVDIVWGASSTNK